MAKTEISNPILRDKYAAVSAQLAKAKDEDKTGLEARMERIAAQDQDMARSALDHTKRLLSGIDKMTVSGLRLSDAENPDVGEVVTLSAEESKPVVAAVKKVLQGRK